MCQVAASSGGIEDSTGRITPASSNTSVIRNAYDYLLNHYSNGLTFDEMTDSATIGDPLIVPGNPFKHQPLIGALLFDNPEIEITARDWGWIIVTVNKLCINQLPCHLLFLCCSAAFDAYHSLCCCLPDCRGDLL